MIISSHMDDSTYAKHASKKINIQSCWDSNDMARNGILYTLGCLMENYMSIKTFVVFCCIFIHMISTKDQQKHASLCSVFLNGPTFFPLKITCDFSNHADFLEHQGCDKRRPDLSITVPWVTWKNTSAMVRTTVSSGQHWHHLHMGTSWYVSWNFITYDHWSGIWLLDQNLSFWSKFCLHETLQPRFTPQCRMGYGFCCPNTTWRSCVGSHVWHRNALDRSTTLRTCHWSPGMCLRWLGWLYVRTIAWSTIQPKIDWIRHDYNWLHIVHRITYSHSIIF